MCLKKDCIGNVVSREQRMCGSGLDPFYDKPTSQDIIEGIAGTIIILAYFIAMIYAFHFLK